MPGSARGLGMVAIGYPVYRFWARPERTLPETTA